MRLEYQDGIDRYLLGRMPDDERKSFEKKCDGNPELKEQLEYTQKVKIVVSERNELLAKFQVWNDEYDAYNNVERHNKRTWIYGLSGIAAIAVVGYFLFVLSDVSTQQSPSVLISMDTNKKVPVADSVVVSIKKGIEDQEQLFAKNDADKTENKLGSGQIDDEQAFCFGKNDISEENSLQADSNEKELEKVVDRKNEVARKLADLEWDQVTGKIDQTVYESSASLLKNQKDRLCWQQTLILLNMNRKDEAIAILDELRSDGGQYQQKADSLYRILIIK